MRHHRRLPLSALWALLFVASVVRRLHTVPEEAGGLAPTSS